MKEYIWLSHLLKNDTPAYGGGESICILHDKKIVDGASCNSSQLKLSNHLGTHVDVPYHFINDGKTISDYTANDWMFNKVSLIEIDVKPDEIISLVKIQKYLDVIEDTDLLIIKTGFEKYRDQTIYWQHSPAYSDDISFFLKEKFQSIKAIGFDSISLTGYQHRELGRKAHKAYLSQDIRIFEDMHLKYVNTSIPILNIIASPLRFEHADGAPCTIMATIDGDINHGSK